MISKSILIAGTSKEIVEATWLYLAERGCSVSTMMCYPKTQNEDDIALHRVFTKVIWQSGCKEEVEMSSEMQEEQSIEETKDQFETEECSNLWQLALKYNNPR